jgi:hypothetical protein
MTRLVLLLLLTFLAPAVQAQTCTQTISSGQLSGNNILSTITAAPVGAVICLNNGTYTVSPGIGQVCKSGRVTIRSTTPLGATLNSLNVSNSCNLTFKDLNLPGGSFQDFGTPQSVNLSWIGNTISGIQASMVINVTGMVNGNFLFYGNTFTGYSADVSGGYEGSLEILGNSSNTGMRIEHNVFDGTGACADGIQISGGSVTIGPGNIFRDWIQGSCGAHVDAIQLLGGAPNIVVQGNFFENNTIHMGIYDGASNVSFLHNIVNGTGTFPQGGVIGMNFSHNTIRAATVGAGTSPGKISEGVPENSGWVVDNNIFVDGAFFQTAFQDGCGSGCLIRNNLADASSTITNCASDGSPCGTVSGTLTGEPTFAGGAIPGSWAGWALSTGSLGKGTATDGKDRGSNFFNPAAPSNFRQN